MLDFLERLQQEVYMRIFKDKLLYRVVEKLELDNASQYNCNTQFNERLKLIEKASNFYNNKFIVELDKLTLDVSEFTKYKDEIQKDLDKCSENIMKRFEDFEERLSKIELLQKTSVKKLNDYIKSRGKKK